MKFKAAAAAGQRKIPLLLGKTSVNLFFENSTRTRTSFGLAARRLGADTLDFSASTSSLSKGETLIDTAKNIEAMGVDMMVVRHHTPGTPHLLAQNLQCSVVNAGDGAHEHPTQGLLDIMTIRQRLGRVAGLTVALVGDISHSRTARSNIWGLKKLGAAGDRLRPFDAGVASLGGVGRGISPTAWTTSCRGSTCSTCCGSSSSGRRPGPSPRSANTPICTPWTPSGWRKAKDDILILAPGPINRGVEVSPTWPTARSPRSWSKSPTAWQCGWPCSGCWAGRK